MALGLSTTVVPEETPFRKDWVAGSPRAKLVEGSASRFIDSPGGEALREGLSIVIAPEGTRSPTSRLGRFKKGAFHLAMAAKVPIVPIVFRNALDALPKQGYVIRPATVEAVVLPPIPTADWSAEELDQRITAIRQLYEKTLHAW